MLLTYINPDVCKLKQADSKIHSLYAHQMKPLKKQDNFADGSENRDNCLYIVQNIILPFSLYQQAAGTADCKGCCLSQSNTEIIIRYQIATLL